MTERAWVLRAVADRIPQPTGDDCVRVGIDGPDGSGKTVFAAELAAELRRRNRPVVRVSADDFHRPRAVRYRRGRDSAEGFWLDSFDHERLWADVLTPLGPGGDRRYRRVGHDLHSDAVLDPEPSTAPPGAVLVLDGLFLHRDELRAAWDFSVLLAVSFEETARRLAARDGFPPDPRHPSLRRYVDAQGIYVAACAPRDRATVVIDNADLAAPRIVKG